MWLLIFPVLSTLSFLAHLKFHGLLLLWIVPMVLLALLLVPSRLNRYIQQLALVIYGLEWIWTTYLLYERRVAMGMPYTTAVCILLGVAAFTILSALVFQTPKLRNYYRNWLPTAK